MRYLIAAIVVFSVLLAACATGSADQPELNPSEETQPMETTQPLEQQIGAVIKAQQALAGKLGIPIEDIQVVKVEDAEWPDACLGLPKKDEMCAQVITPGYQVTLQAQGKQYIYRTNMTGMAVRLEMTSEGS